LDVFSDNEMSSEPVDLKGAFEEALAFARGAAKAFGIGKPETLTVDTKKIAEGMKDFDARKSAKKEAKRVKKAGA
jgi:polysaccharide deacetylase 2 family uncharacterized protein YibQ